jgi:hypothetical protein
MTNAETREVTGATATFENLRNDCYDAVLLGLGLDGDIRPILDEVFDLVVKAVRRRFGISTHDAELLLADARNELEHLIGKHDLDDLVNVHQAINAIAEHLAEDATE